MQKQQNRKRDIPALNDHPLPNAVDVDKYPFRNASLECDTGTIDQSRWFTGAPGAQIRAKPKDRSTTTNQHMTKVYHQP